MARIVTGSTERQLTEKCRQCVIKIGIVSSSECHWYWHSLSGPHYMRVFTFTYQETQVFSELRGCADKSLARPGRKQATVNKLGIYSTHSPRSSIRF
jgi:hypothetical protein